MSGSYLPRKNGPRSGHELERGAPLSVRQPEEAGYADYAFYQDRSSGGGRAQLEKIVDLIFRRKWIVLASFLVVLAATALYTMTLVPQYKASSFVMVELLGKVPMRFSPTTSTTGDPFEVGYSLFARNDRTIYSEIRLLQISDQLAQRVYQRFQEEAVRSRDSVAGRVPDTSATAPDRTELPHVPFNGSVDFTADRSADNVLLMNGSSSDPERAALLANLYAEEYVRLTQEASRSSATALRKSLEEQEREYRKTLSSVEEQIQRYQLDEGGVGLSMDGTRLLQQLTMLETQRDEARIALSVEKASLESLEQELKVISPQLAKRIASDVDRRIADLQTKLATEEDKVQEILLKNPELRDRRANIDALQPFNTRIRQLRAEIDSLSVQWVEEVTSAGGITGSTDGLAHVSNLRRQIAEKHVLINEMEARLGVMEKRLTEYEGELDNIPAQSMQLAQMERARMQAEQMYQSVVQKLQEARTAVESDPGYARLLRRAKVPRASVYPDPRRNLIFGAFLGLVLGLVLAVVRDKLDNRIYKPDQLREQGLKEIGVIPNLEQLIKEDYQGQPFLEQGGHRFSTSLVTLVNPIAAATEAYRHVRTNIQFNHPEADIQTLLVASPGVMEGKSTTTANLAIVMAQAGRRTLLIDADLRRPQQHRIFGLKRDAGLIECLAESANVDPEAWKTYVDNLYVLTAGRTIGSNGKHADDGGIEGRIGLVANPAELLGSGRMHEVLQAMRESFDVIIIDTPPVLAATDAALLSTQCDAAIVVARAGKTKEGELSYALEAFNDVGTPILGVLLNAFDISMAYGLKYRYQHYTRYGRYSKYGYYGYRDGR